MFTRLKRVKRHKPNTRRPAPARPHKIRVIKGRHLNQGQKQALGGMQRPPASCLAKIICRPRARESRSRGVLALLGPGSGHTCTSAASARATVELDALVLALGRSRISINLSCGRLAARVFARQHLAPTQSQRQIQFPTQANCVCKLAKLHVSVWACECVSCVVVS